MAKRVLIFSLAYYPSHVSGAEIAIKEITDRIDSSDIAFSMVTHRFDPALPSEEQIGHVRVYRVGFGSSYFSKMLFIPLAAWKAASLHRVHAFDASWVMMTYMLFPLVLAKVFGMRGPYILTLQDGDSYQKVFERMRIRPLTLLLNWGFRNATMVQAISTYLATWPKRRGYKYDDVAVIPNGASVESSQEYPPQEIDALTHSLGKNEGDVFLLCIGRLVHQKAVDTVIRAVALLPTNVHLIVVGSGEERHALETLAETLGVGDRVQLVGHVDRNETAKYRRVCNIFVSPSRSEGQGISLVSSMLSGIPIIATQVGGIADFLFDAKRNPAEPTTGWAVDVDSPEQVAEAVTYIVEHPDQAREVTTTAKELVLRRYNWDVIVPAMREKVFAKVFSSQFNK